MAHFKINNHPKGVLSAACQKHPKLIPGLFCFVLTLLSNFPDYDLKGGPPFPLMKPRITAIFYVCAFAT